MFEVKVTIEAPALVNAVNNLVSVLAAKPQVEAAAPVAAITATTQAAPAIPVETPQVLPTVSPVPAVEQAAAPVTIQQNQPPVSAPVNTAPAPAQQPAQTPEVPAQQTKDATPITLDAIARAGAKLIDQGMMSQIMGLLTKYGVQAVTQLEPGMYDAFAAELRGFGAQI